MVFEYRAKSGTPSQEWQTNIEMGICGRCDYVLLIHIKCASIENSDKQNMKKEDANIKDSFYS
jgi:hypothetical protein